jgi:hypothetical protein
MATGPEAWKHNALSAIREAEKAAWEYLLCLVRIDLGAELASHLDPEFCTCKVAMRNVGVRIQLSPPLRGDRPLRLNSDVACLAVRPPDSTEWLVQWYRNPRGCGGDYDDLVWEPLPWYHINPKPGAPNQSGRFAVVRYALNQKKPEEAFVEPADFAQWHLTDNPEYARVVGGEVFKEHQRLNEEAEQVRKIAQDQLLHRLRNIAKPKGGP